MQPSNPRNLFESCNRGSVQILFFLTLSGMIEYLPPVYGRTMEASDAWETHLSLHRTRSFLHLFRIRWGEKRKRKKNCGWFQITYDNEASSEWTVSIFNGHPKWNYDYFCYRLFLVSSFCDRLFPQIWIALLSCVVPDTSRTPFSSLSHSYCQSSPSYNAVVHVTSTVTPPFCIHFSCMLTNEGNPRV